MSELLSVANIHTKIGQFLILEDVSFSVQEGGITVLLGRNGAGKTTSLRSIIGQLKPTEGSIKFRQEELIGRPSYDIVKMGIGYVPEHRAIFNGLTVEENLQISERDKGQLKNRIDLIFDLFPDLKRLYHWPAGQLSGGQQQMLSIARALVPDNNLLLIDEPSEGLAPILIEQIMTVIKQLSDEITVLLVEQNFRVASQLADSFTIIENGRSVLSGEMKELLDQPDTITRYLGAA
jgi:branched-chain amino acid transport system ATP-binding protein